MWDYYIMLVRVMIVGPAVLLIIIIIFFIPQVVKIPGVKNYKS